MSKLKIITPNNPMVGVLRHIIDKYSLTVAVGYPTGNIVGDWTETTGYWIVEGLGDWTAVQSELTSLSLASEILA